MDHESAFSVLRQWRKRISTGMDQILPGLYVGGLRDAIDGQQLDENKIHAIVSIHGFTKDCDFGGAKVEVLRVVLNDSPGENVLKHFSATNSFIHAHRLRQENVLVHCLAGASRSVCICVAYLMTVTNLNYSSALEYIGHKRYCARPNFGFKMQLMKFGEKYISAERQRLFGEFNANDQNDFIKLHRSDCLFTNSLFVEEAKETEMHFCIVENGSSESRRSSKKMEKEGIGEIGEGPKKGEANKLVENLHFIDQ